MEKIAVIGAGAWGTALAVNAANAGSTVILQAHEPEVVAEINAAHTNTMFLPGITLPSAIQAVESPVFAIQNADAAILVVPAQHLRAVCQKIASAGAVSLPLLICAKGIELGSGALMSEVVEQELPASDIAVLSGPTFAKEVAAGLPAAVTIACEDAKLADQFVQAIGRPEFRPYTSDDVVGAEIGGAVKNVLAIACGIVEGKGLGDNTRAALITRGLAEIVRLGMAKGAKPETLMGLCGVGDLTLTCNAMQSRNFSLGVALGKGETLASILETRQAVTEGVASAKAVIELAGRLGVDMPICTAVNAIVTHGRPIDEVIQGLLARPVGKELP